MYTKVSEIDIRAKIIITHNIGLKSNERISTSGPIAKINNTNAIKKNDAYEEAFEFLKDSDISLSINLSVLIIKALPNYPEHSL